MNKNLNNDVTMNLPINLIHKKKDEKGATSTLVGVNWCEIHKEWLIKGLMFPVGTELNYVINN